MTKKPNLDLDAILDKYDTKKKKEEVETFTQEPVEKPTETIQKKEEPRNFHVLMRGTKNDVRVIRKSEYDSLIHICL